MIVVGIAAIIIAELFICSSGDLVSAMQAFLATMYQGVHKVFTRKLNSFKMRLKFFKRCFVVFFRNDYKELGGKENLNSHATEEENGSAIKIFKVLVRSMSQFARCLIQLLQKN